MIVPLDVSTRWPTAALAATWLKSRVKVHNKETNECAMTGNRKETNVLNNVVTVVVGHGESNHGEHIRILKN